MQSFIFISGFLSSDNSIKLSNAIKLLILYYIFNFTFSLIIYFYIKAPINFLYPKYSYWYILSLFYWRISIETLNNIPFIFTISIIITLLEGFWDCFTNVLSIYRTIVFFPFFLAGYKIKKMNILDKLIILRKNNIKFLLFLLCSISFSYFLISYIIKNNITNSALLMSTYNQKNTIKQRITIMIISSIKICLFLLIIPTNKLPIINKWGMNSLYIYLFHRIFIYIWFR